MTEEMATVLRLRALQGRIAAELEQAVDLAVPLPDQAEEHCREALAALGAYRALLAA